MWLTIAINNRSALPLPSRSVLAFCCYSVFVPILLTQLNFRFYVQAPGRGPFAMCIKAFTEAIARDCSGPAYL